MHHVLTVDIVQGQGDLCANRGDLIGRQRSFLQQRFYRWAGDEFHHDIRPLEIPGGDEARDVRARKPRQDHLLNLVANDREWIFAGS